ncbi:chaperonin 10-like protein [Aspergillus desertorum]
MAASEQFKEMRNPSCFLHGPGKAEIEDQPVPELTDPHEVLVRIEFVGVCGSDVHFWRHGGIQTHITAPLVMGYEASGTVAAVETSVTRVKFWRAPEDFVHCVAAEGISLQEVVLLEPLAVAVHGVWLAQIKPGETVIVTGYGTEGMLCAAVAVRVFGAHRVIVLDCRGQAEENAVAIKHRFDLDEGSVDAVIEASGAQSSIQLGAGLGESKARAPMLALSEKELRIMGCFRYGADDFALAVEVAERRLVVLKPLISTVTPFYRATEAWEMAGRGEGIKNLIEGVRD